METRAEGPEETKGLVEIDFVRLRCPYCGSERVTVQRTMPDGVTRYQLCEGCGKSFRAKWR